MQLVVPSAVTAAVAAAIMMRRITSHTLFFPSFISVPPNFFTLHFPSGSKLFTLQ